MDKDDEIQPPKYILPDLIKNNIGKSAYLKKGNMEINVFIRDVKLKPLSIEFLIEAAHGNGATWVDEKEIEVPKE